MPVPDAVRVIAEKIRAARPWVDVSVLYTEVMRAQCGRGPYAATWAMLRDYTER